MSTDSSSSSGRGWPLVAVGLGVLFLVGVRAASFFTADDAFVTFRYAANFGSGGRAVWNAGDDPVEGFTSFLWMVWHTPFAVFGVSLPVVAKVTSGVAGAVALFMAVRYAWQVGGVISSLVAGVAFVGFLPTYFHIGGGLETMAYAALLLRVVVVVLDTIDDLTIRAWEMPVLVVLLGMLRPEGLIAAAPAALVWLWLLRRDRQALVWTAGAAMAGLVYFIWRWTYYGYLLPNPAYLRDDTGGTSWLQENALAFAPLLLLTVALVVPARLRPAGALLTCTVGAVFATYVLTGQEPDSLYRFAFHAFPLLCLGAGLAVGVFQRWYAATGAGLVAVGWVVVFGIVAAELPTTETDDGPAHVAIGRGLATAGVAADQRVLAVSEPGAIPYYSDWKTLDLSGRNDEAIAHGANPTQRLRQVNPTVVIMRSEGDRAAGEVDFGAVLDGYELVTTVRVPGGAVLNVFAKPRWSDQVRASIDAEPGR